MGLSRALRPHHSLYESAEVVDVVSCRLDVEAAEILDLRRLLDPEELARADRFHTGRLRDTFLVAHGRLRQLLGLVLGCQPSAVHLVVQPGGKPRLCPPAGDRLRFNLAHSAGMMVCAFALDHDVGIDVEHVRNERGWEDIALRFFALPERHALSLLPPAARLSAFFAYWTCKEAVVKATGEGLARPLDSFVVSVTPDHPEILLCDESLGPPENWRLAVVPVAAGYHAALAVRGAAAGASIRFWSWEQLASVAE